MKKLILTIVFMITQIATALECGETKSSMVSQETRVNVETNMPKFLAGSTITLTKADGSKEVLKAEEYMIVKRKHVRPMVKESIKETTMACQNVSNKNILSAKLVDGYSDVKKEESGNSATLKVERQVGVGVQYQRALTEKVYLGGEVDSNRGVGVSIGVGF